MHQAIEGKTDTLMGMVSDQKPYYTPKDLITFGYPALIVEGIRLRVKQILTSELSLPQTKYAATEDKLVKEAWQDFQQTVFSNSVIPREDLYDLTDQVVSETVNLFLQPRKQLPDFLYGDRDELSLHEVQERIDQLTVYKHFGRAIPRYMQKRNLQTLQKKRCTVLIQRLDENLVSSYSSDDWAQLLKPLFKFFDGKIKPELVRLFFEDKELYLASKTFGDLNKDVSIEEFKQVLSNPDLLNPKLQEEYKNSYSEKQKFAKETATPFVAEEASPEKKQKNLLENFLGDYEIEAEEEEETTDEESLNALFKAEQERTMAEELESLPEDEGVSPPINKRKDDTTEFRENLTSVLDLAADSFNNLKKENESEPESEPTGEPEESGKDEIVVEEELGESHFGVEASPKAEEEEEDDDKPMWQQFISPEQMELIRGNRAETEDDEREVGIFVEEEDLTDEPVAVGVKEEDEIPDLRVHLLGQEVFYIEEIFNGSEADYERILKRIRVHDNWEEAAEYLHNDVFSTYNVDMFSDAAVDFTDQLQSYFNEYKN